MKLHNKKETELSIIQPLINQYNNLNNIYNDNISYGLYWGKEYIMFLVKNGSWECRYNRIYLQKKENENQDLTNTEKTKPTGAL